MLSVVSQLHISGVEMPLICQNHITILIMLCNLLTVIVQMENGGNQPLFFQYFLELIAFSLVK